MDIGFREFPFSAIESIEATNSLKGPSSLRSAANFQSEWYDLHQYNAAMEAKAVQAFFERVASNWDTMRLRLGA